eukprot:2509110-Rhodomonas_salina.4
MLLSAYVLATRCPVGHTERWYLPTHCQVLTYGVLPGVHSKACAVCIGLRVWCYAMYSPKRLCSSVCLRARYAMPGTDIAYAGTAVLRNARY